MSEALPPPPSPYDAKQFEGFDPTGPMAKSKGGCLAYGTIILIIGFCFWSMTPTVCTFDPTRTKVSRVRSDHRSLATALEAYYVDHEAYPAYTTDVTLSEAARFYKGKPNKKQPWNAPTFWRADAHLAGLTTPVAYISSMFGDPFANVKGRPFAYYTRTSGEDVGWILYSPGPDGKIDITETDYNPAIPQPSPQLIAKSYDPTNGTVSGGDVWRVR